METVRERILANLKTALERVTVENGYNFDLAVQRWSMNGNSLVNLPAVIISPGNEDETALPNQYEECVLTVYLDVFFVNNADDAVATDTYLSRLQGDIKKAVLADATMGGEAIDTDVRGTTPFEVVEGQPCSGIIVEVVIRYRHRRDDPTAKF